MDFDQLLSSAFGTTDLSALSQDQLLAGVEALRARFARGGDADDRFALWCLLYMLGGAPDPDEAFEAEPDRAAAREFVASIDQDDDD